ncbi:MAG: SDR family oxidoreductase [Acidimicrobiaceae bacterium]|nr:SDR family oxidoreductase [Acidimicrobiaceae bacterium]
MDLGLSDRVALVTASSKGLGFATAAALAADGARVAITGRDPTSLDRAAAELRASTGTDVLTVAGDITDPQEPARVVGAVVDRWSRLDVLVANAGGPPAGRALEITDEQIAEAVNANLVTTVRLVRAALPHLEASGQGRICAITSYSVHQPLPGLSLSNLARVGLWGWAKTAAQDLVEKGVTLNLICPGAHRTERMVHLGLTGRAGDPADFGRAAAFLCSSSAAFISGTSLVVDGGATLGL